MDSTSKSKTMSAPIHYLEYLIPLAIVYIIFGAPGLNTLGFTSIFSPLAVPSDEAVPPLNHTVSIDAANFIDHTQFLPQPCPSPPATKVHVYSRKPLIIYIESFLLPDEVSSIIKLTTPSLAPSLVGASTDTLTANLRIRNSTTAPLAVDDALSVCIARRAQSIQGWPKDLWLEKLMAQRYIAPYGHYSHHYDWASPSGKAGRRQAGGRQSSFMVWLNDPAKGGGTNFPRVPLHNSLADRKGVKSEWCRFVECESEVARRHEGTTFKALEGNAVFWENFRQDDGGLVEESWHAGLPVEEGEKWGLNVWSWWLPGWNRESEA